MSDDDHRCIHASEADASFFTVVATLITACEHRTVEVSPCGLEVDPMLDRIGPILGLIPLECHDIVYV